MAILRATQQIWEDTTNAGHYDAQAGLMDLTRGSTSSIPAARLRGIQVIWLNWGLTEQDLNTMPLGITRTSSSFPMPAPESNTFRPSKPGMIRVKNLALYKGLGADLGAVRVEHAGNVQDGKILVCDSWNAEIYGPLEKEYYEKHQF
ncbi:Isochorismatase hydrolase [Penicillium herquei]|nr:Isochorismatase hydrolase [Penicillium herquei]